MNLFEKANKIYLKNFKPITYFERAIFLSWYCSIADCKFCYMSTQKTTKKAKRTLSSILAEVYFCKLLNWKIEFLSSGFNAHNQKELLTIVKNVKKIYKEKIWLNTGIIKNLKPFKPYIKGITAAIETLEPELHKKLCPSKPIELYEEMFNNTDLKKAITIIIGLGEKIKNIDLLFNFIKKHNINRITFYSLKPIKNTQFKKSPKRKYYASWIARTRIKFPKIKIISGITPRTINHISLLLKAGSNSITKFPAIRYFNTKKAKVFEKQIKSANRKFIGTLTKLPKINLEEINKLNLNKKLKKEVKIKINTYLKKIYKNNFISS